MGYSDTLLNASAEASIAIEELIHQSGSWSWSDWEGLKANLKVAGGYKKYFSLPSGSTSSDADNWCTQGDLATWVNHNANLCYAGNNTGWWGTTVSHSAATFHSGSSWGNTSSVTLNQWTGSYGPTDLSAVPIYDPESE
tara:strand:- start:1014 stop:1430 length:417 start_codon:yes stop_codon:yes gene_type:complete